MYQQQFFWLFDFLEINFWFCRKSMGKKGIIWKTRRCASCKNINYSPSDNFKSRDASSSKKYGKSTTKYWQSTEKVWKITQKVSEKCNKLGEKYNVVNKKYNVIKKKYEKVCQSELSAGSMKRDVENTPKCTCQDCIPARWSILGPPPVGGIGPSKNNWAVGYSSKIVACLVSKHIDNLTSRLNVRFELHKFWTQ